MGTLECTGQGFSPQLQSVPFFEVLTCSKASWGAVYIVCMWDVVYWNTICWRDDILYTFTHTFTFAQMQSVCVFVYEKSVT